MSSLSNYAGAGTTLSSTFYMRNFYSKNTNARTSSTRANMDNNELSFADSVALRRAIRELGSFSYEEEEDTNIRNSVLAFIDTYNNTLSSVSDSTDHSLERYSKQLKSIAKEYSDSLDKIGITVNDDGSLTSRESLFKSASLSKFESLFSRDSDFMQRTSAVSKRIMRRSEAIDLTEKRKKLDSLSTKSSADSTSTDTGTAVAQLVAESLDLDTASITGIGGTVDVSL